MNSTYIFPQVDTLIHHQALLFMCAVPSFKMISLEQKALLVTDTTELLAIFRKVNWQLGVSVDTTETTCLARWCWSRGTGGTRLTSPTPASILLAGVCWATSRSVTGESLLSPLRGDTRYTNHHFPFRRLWEQLRRLMKLDKVGQVNSDGFLYVNKSGVCRFWCSSWSCTASWTWRTWRYSGPQSLENTARDISIWTEITGAADGKYIYGYLTTDNIQVSAGKNDHGKTIFEGNPWN